MIDPENGYGGGVIVLVAGEFVIPGGYESVMINGLGIILIVGIMLNKSVDELT